MDTSTKVIKSNIPQEKLRFMCKECGTLYFCESMGKREQVRLKVLKLKVWILKHYEKSE